MKLEQLRYFVGVAKHGSIHKAAEALYVSQPNISRAITNLEEEVGAPLLLRDNKGAKLTRVGESLFFYAQTILGHMDAIDRLKDAKDSEVVSYLKVAVAKLFLPDDVMLNYSDRISSDKKIIHLDETNVEGVMNGVRSLEDEIGIVVINDLQLQAFHKIAELQELELHCLGTSPAYVHVGKQSVLAKFELMELQELLSYANIRIPQDFFTRFYDTTKFDGISLTDFKYILFMNNYHSIINLLKHKDAFIYGHKWQMEELDKSGIKSIPLNIDLQYHLYWIKRKKEILSQEANLFVDMITKLYSTQ